MTDKPIAAKIILPLKNKKSTGIEFLSFSTDLYINNLVYNQPRELRKTGSNLELMVIFCDTNSYKNWSKNPYITEYYSEKFKTLLTEKPKTIIEDDVVLSVDKVEVCSCKTSKFYLLKGRSLGYDNELVCGTCLNQVSQAKITKDIKLEHWQREHERVYMLWLDSGILEKWALKELTNYKKGKLNIEGQKIRSQLSFYFNKPVYFCHFVEERFPDQLCPICNGKGTKSGLTMPFKFCKKCNTCFGEGPTKL